MKVGDLVVLKGKHELKTLKLDYEWGEISPGRRFGFYLRNETCELAAERIGPGINDINDDDMCLLLGWNDTGDLVRVMNPRQQIGYVNGKVVKVIS